MDKQAIIARMNYNALTLKALCMALVIFLLYMESPDGALIASIWFMILDSYYLSIERSMRDKGGFAILSPSVWGYYGLLIVISLYV